MEYESDDIFSEVSFAKCFSEKKINFEVIPHSLELEVQKNSYFARSEKKQANNERKGGSIRVFHPRKGKISGQGSMYTGFASCVCE